MLNLRHETLNQTNIPSGDAKKSGYCLLIRKIIGIGFQAMTPALLQKKARLLLGQRLHLMSETDPRVELRCACQTLLQSWHAEQNQAKAPSIVHIMDLLETRILEAVGFIDNQQLDERRIATGHQKVFFALMALIGCLNQV